MAPLTQLELPLAGPQVLQDLVVVLLEGVDVGVQERRRVLVAFLLRLQLVQPPFQELHLGLQGGQARHLLLKEGGEKGQKMGHVVCRGRAEGGLKEQRRPGGERFSFTIHRMSKRLLKKNELTLHLPYAKRVPSH